MSNDNSPADSRLFSPSTARNREPIHGVLSGLLGESARLLEFASGSGEHAVYMAERHPGWQWQPSDINEAAIQSIEAWRTYSGLSNILPAQRRNLLADDDAIQHSAEHWNAMLAINLIHISPWQVTERLMGVAGQQLVSGGLLFLYGPYRRNGKHTAPSNAEFDAWLKARDPSWGVRDLEQVIAEAAGNSLTLHGVEQLPANNLAVTFQRA